MSLSMPRPTIRRKRQATNTVLVALMVAFTGSMLGVVFGVMLGEVSGREAWIIGLVAVVTGRLLALLSLKPVMATGFITGGLTIYLVFHLNIGAIFAYQARGNIVLIVPYITCDLIPANWTV